MSTLLKVHDSGRGRRLAWHFALVVCAGMLPAVFSGQVQAQFPDRVIKGIVPFPPGGGTDIFARLLAQHMSKALGHPVVIENRGGADGNIGMDAVAKSNPDGYTILFNSSAATVNPAMYRTLPFDPVKDLKPVAIVCEYYNLILVNPVKVPVKSLGEFVELVRKNPGKINVAAGGTRLAVDLFRLQNNLDMAVIPYRGASDAIAALLSGNVDLMIVNAPGLTAHIASGKVRALAITATQRQPDWPDVPTTREAGMPDYRYSSYFGVYVPSAVPADVVRKLNSAINAITAMKEVSDKFRELSATAVQRTPEEASRRYLGDIASLRDIVTRAKIPTVN